MTDDLITFIHAQLADEPGAVPTEWILLVGIDFVDDPNAHSVARVVSNDSLALHRQLGLLEAGATRVRAHLGRLDELG
jgi:hypothetical protein